ncbi:MAG TPA: cytochrome c [Opitutaceae bacterium]|jgi:cytochrome c2|nr:cytochrome c [Opitutaceae bacterium]
MKLLHAAAASLCILAAAGTSRAIDLHGERASPFDLEIKGTLSGVPQGASRYVRWEDIRALPSSKVTLDGEFLKGPEVLTVVFLSDLLGALPATSQTNLVLATCDDGYVGIYTADFISRYRPFLVLEIDGKGPQDWPPKGLDFNPAPYVITVSAELVPDVVKFMDIEHKKPWAVTTIEVANYGAKFMGFYSGKWAALSPSAKAGREIWVNSCASCHGGPEGTFGGAKAQRPFQVLAAYAAFDRPFFVKYVRDPKSLVASAKMEAHPHYTDANFADLIAFITADGK